MNELIIAAVTTALPLVGFAFYRTALQVILTPANIDQIGNQISRMVRNIKNKEDRLDTKKKIAYIAADILNDIGFGMILKSNYQNLIDTASNGKTNQ